MTTSLHTYMNGNLVGRLEQKNTGALKFTYDPTWLEWEYARPISLSMPLTDRSYVGSMVYNFFDNLLPDSKLIRDRIQRRFAAKTNECFDLLSYIGHDCVGALQLLPKLLTNDNYFILNSQVISDAGIAKLLLQYKTAPLGMQENTDFRISIAGAQEKTALLRYNKRWCLPFDTTPTTHIFKLPIGMIEHSGLDLTDSVENEWLCLHILEAFGLPTAKVKIGKFANVKALIVERFDRIWTAEDEKLLRIPQEDMCQALSVPSSLKYEADGGPGIKQIMDLLRSSINADQDRYNFMKTVFLFWIMGAIDGHAKNFSLTIEPGGKYKLTPLYDVISAFPLLQTRQLELKKIKMAMAVIGNKKHYAWRDIQLRHWLSTAEYCRFPKQYMLNIIEECLDPMESIITKISSSMPSEVPAYIPEAIFSNMLSLRNQVKL